MQVGGIGKVVFQFRKHFFLAAIHKRDDTLANERIRFLFLFLVKTKRVTFFSPFIKMNDGFKVLVLNRFFPLLHFGVRADGHVKGIGNFGLADIEKIPKPFYVMLIKCIFHTCTINEIWA